MTSLVSKVVQTVRRYDLFQPGARLLVGVSGGPDSVALLRVLHVMSKEWRLCLHAVHVNHQLRGKESEADEQFVRRLCDGLGIPLWRERVDALRLKKAHGGSLEDICRNERYRIFIKVAVQVGLSTLVVGHHKNDLAETVLMRLLRGSGSGGLSAFAPKTQFQGLVVVRPFYNISRDEILTYLSDRKVAWRVDSSNKDTRFLRNKIRLQLLPYLERHFNPRVVDALARSAQLLQEDDATLGAQTRRLYARLSRKRGDGCVIFSLKKLEELSPQRLNRLLHHALRHFRPGNLPPDMDIVLQVEGLVRRGRAGNIVRLPYDMIAYRSYEELALLRVVLPRRISKRAILDAIEPRLGDAKAFPRIASGKSFRIGYADFATAKPFVNTIYGMRIVLSREPCTTPLRKRILRGRGNANVEYFDAALMRHALSVRTRRAGDIFQAFGAAGKKRLKDFFIDEKIPAHIRSKIPLLCQGKLVLWIIGCRRSDMARILPSTKEVIRVQLIRNVRR